MTECKKCGTEYKDTTGMFEARKKCPNCGYSASEEMFGIGIKNNIDKDMFGIGSDNNMFNSGSNGMFDINIDSDADDKPMFVVDNDMFSFGTPKKKVPKNNLETE